MPGRVLGSYFNILCAKIYTNRTCYDTNHLKRVYIPLAILASLFIYMSALVNLLLHDEFHNAPASNVVKLENEELSRNIQMTAEYTMTISKMLDKYSVPKNDIIKIIEAMKNAGITYDLVKPGHEIMLNFDNNIDGIEESSGNEFDQFVIQKIAILPQQLNKIEITRINEEFIAKQIITAPQMVIAKARLNIQKDLTTTLKDYGLPRRSIIEITSAYSYLGNKHNFECITLIFEKHISEDKKLLSYGKVLAASLETQSKKYNIYKYNLSGKETFVLEDGRSSQHNLLLHPVRAAGRISAPFGYREHPIYGGTTLHRGIDFSAKLGTPIIASGGGVISDMGYHHGYGHYIKIRHSPTLSTFYAHIHKFDNKISKGMHVAQGQVIAFIGSSGVSTGPHLHFEVHINGNPVNPATVKTFAVAKITGEETKKFEDFKHKILNIVNELDIKEEIVIN